MLAQWLTLPLLLVCGIVHAAAGAVQPVASAQDLQVVAYHDVRDAVIGDYDTDQYAVSTGNLISHFRWLKANGFTPISIDQLLAARAGEEALPAKPVLLTFDDGLQSVYTHVFPLLKLFGYPAVVSLVTNWIETDSEVFYAGRKLQARDFLSWKQIRELQESGLVEIASHSHDLHKGVSGNPQGNEQPAAVTRIYHQGNYETGEQREMRLRNDLATSTRVIHQNTGRSPRIMTWPYGAFDTRAASIATELGMPVSMTLEPNFGVPANSNLLHRHLIAANPGIAGFAGSLMHPTPAAIVRAAQVDLDYVFDPDPRQQERNLDHLVERIHNLQISHVFLQAFADPDGDGGADALYFPNRHLPVRADLFNRAAWQLKTRAGVRVFAWLPLLSFSGENIPPQWQVLQEAEPAPAPDPYSEPRLTPFDPQARRFVSEIYEDLATHAHFDGLHFHDDGRLNQLEDASAAARVAYHEKFGEELGSTLAGLPPDTAQRWSDFKTQALLSLSDELAGIVRQYHPGLKTSRNLFAPALLDPAGPGYLAQDFDSYLIHYDYTAVMAMPFLEGAGDDRQARNFYRQLVRQVSLRPGAMQRTIFQLQTVDWRDKQRLDSVTIKQTLRWLQSMGVANLAYYPDDFIGNHPELSELRQGISLARYPWSARP